MDIGSALARLGRAILLGFGMLALVSVEFAAPALVEDPAGARSVEVRLSGAINDEVAHLVERSVAVSVRVDFDLYLADGGRARRSSEKRLSYRSIDGTYAVDGPGGRFETESLAEAVLAAETHGAALPGGAIKSIVMRGSLVIPGIADKGAVEALWGGREPSLVFEPGRP